MDAEEKVRIAEALMEKAEEHLEAARIILRHGLYRDSISRAYYAAYSALTAALTLLGRESKTHGGAINLLKTYLIDRGLVDREYGKILSRLFEMRQTSDYQASFYYELEDARWAVENADKFMRKMAEIIETISEKLRAKYSIEDAFKEASEY